MRRWLWRGVLTLGGLLGSYVGMSCLLFVLGLHRASLPQQIEQWRPLPVPQLSQRVLIVAPHPDDEVLGCGGVIAAAVRMGVPVRVVYLTCGDGYAGAATLLARRTPTPDDFLALGSLRIEEARRSAQRLGLTPDALVFLGYPDRQLWQMALAGSDPLRSPATHCDRVPYPQALRPGAPCTADALVADLRRALTDFQPTHIFVTHPLDDHPDHLAAPLYVWEAVAQAWERGDLLVQPELFYYLVHRGDWPLPQGYHPRRALAPPRGLEQAPWLQLKLDGELLMRKQAALRAHESQYALMGRFLNSFLRTSELFLAAGVLEPNPIDDNPVLHLRPGADLQRVAVQASDAGLQLQVWTRQPLTAPIQLQITLVGVTCEARWQARTWLYRPERRRLFEGAVQAHGAHLTFWLPVRDLRSLKRAYLLVQTRLYQMELDRSGFMPVPLAPSGAYALAAGDDPSRAAALQSALSDGR